MIGMQKGLNLEKPQPDTMLLLSFIPFIPLWVSCTVEDSHGKIIPASVALAPNVCSG